MSGSSVQDARWLPRQRLRLLDSMAESQLRGASAEASVRRRGLAQAVILVLALPMNLVTAAFLVAGVGCLVRGPTGLRVLGVLALVAFLATAPRPDRRTLSGLTRDRAPALFALLDAVGAATGAPVPVRVQLDTRFNCAVTLVRRQPVLILGAPMWSAMTGEARLGVLGHELGHLAHRDLLVGRWVGAAVESAHHWYDVGRAGGSLNRRGARGVGRGNPGAIVAAVLLGAFRAMAAGYLWLLATVNAAASRRREYLADQDSITAGGSDGALAMLDTLLAVDAVRAALTRASLDPTRPDLWSAVAAATAGDSVETRLRRRAAADGDGDRIDASHPRTELRIRLVAQHADVNAAVVASPSTWALIDKELAPAMNALGDRARDALRYGRR